MATQSKNGGENRGGVEIGLNAAIVALDDNEPMIITVADEDHRSPVSLPFGQFNPLLHRTMEMGVREFVRQQTGITVGYIEQLYTFGDRGRAAAVLEADEMHVVSIGYLALTRMSDEEPLGAFWRRWYSVFPWEDWRQGAPEIIEREILPRLKQWTLLFEAGMLRRSAIDRLNICFGIGGAHWDEEKVLDRYELLYEAGLMPEAKRDGRVAAEVWADLPVLGVAFLYDHRRILATAMSRMRAKIKYRPVIFDLMPQSFTLFDLQRSVEAISGNLLHKQNFRRLVEKGGLVEATGEMTSDTGGRPAKIFRFRKEVLLERRTAGVRVRG